MSLNFWNRRSTFSDPEKAAKERAEAEARGSEAGEEEGESDGLVQVPATDCRTNGLSGKASNHKKNPEQDEFTLRVKDRRSATGRTRNPSGRFHGAEYVEIVP